MLRGRPALALFALVLFSTFAAAQTRVPIRLTDDHSLSPDGKSVAFSWRGDIWIAASAGGEARRLTINGARDRSPVFSPDGKSIAFLSDREDSAQIFVLPLAGGEPRRVTAHSDGYALKDWMPDGQGFLTTFSRDHAWSRPERIAVQPLDGKSAPRIYFDDYGANPSLAADGRKLLFNREFSTLYRKAYKGSQDAQVWLFDVEKGTFAALSRGPGGARWPLFAGPEATEYYFVGAPDGVFNLYRASVGDPAKPAERLTNFKDDGIVFPAISRDGKTLVFRVLFDLYRFDVAAGQATKIELYDTGDSNLDLEKRVTLAAADDVAFSADGREIAFIAGGDVFVMDTVLSEPVAVTTGAEEEREILFSPDHQTLYFVSDSGGQSDIWSATKTDKKSALWQQTSFSLTRLTNDTEVEDRLRLYDDGKKIAYSRLTGNVMSIGVEGGTPSVLIESWSGVDFDFSPDQKWIVYDKEDDNNNHDIWIRPTDASSPPFNLSCHPDNDRSPKWSSDGKVIAFTSRRFGEEVDIVYAYLTKSKDEETDRDRKLEKALEKMKERASGAPAGVAAGAPSGGDPAPGAGGPPGGPGRGGRRRGGPPNQPSPNPSPNPEPQPDPKPETAPTDTQPTTQPTSQPAGKKPEPVVIDFDGLYERIRRIAIPDSFERLIAFWPESQKLLFNATIEGKSGVYTVEFPEDIRPKAFGPANLSNVHVIAESKQLGCIDAGKPAIVSRTGAVTSYAFTARQSYTVGARHRAIFAQAWWTMRDRFYDERLGNRNWDEVRRKYEAMAAETADADELSKVCNMMLGELNGSHLGFSMSEGRGGGRGRGPGALPGPVAEGGGEWRTATGHLGLRFDPSHKGPGLLVKDVLKGTPAAHAKSLIRVGEIILSIDGKNVDPGLDLAPFLTGVPDRDILVLVRSTAGVERTVKMRPTSSGAVREALYDKWLADNRAAVDRLSGGELGYLHIRGMGDQNLLDFDTELYRVGNGKNGLVIDVRENGGGSTTDHLLTVLTQPVHAITVGRGGGPGYPQDRKVYATWNKPIVVLCNQNSFSNAEVFSHAIQVLKRGQLVGVPTAGGVISTGATGVMGLGTLRLPGRGWYVLDTGEDMELNGAVPEHIVWPHPGDVASGKDAQLAKAVEVLQADVKKWSERPQPKLRKATERK